MPLRLSAPARHAAFLAAAYAGIGVTMPFLPPFLAGRGLEPEAVAAVLFAGSATRFLAGPPLGRLAERLGDARRLLIPAGLAAGLAAMIWAPAHGFLAVLAVQILFAFSIAPIGPVGEALALAAAREARVEYGKVRAPGSVAFILGSLLAGWLANRLGYDAMPWLLGACYLATAFAAWALPRRLAPGRATERAVPLGLAARLRRGFGLHLMRHPGFARMILLTALIQGSHAAYYGFGSIHWARAGHSADTIGLLWAVSVAAEVALLWWAQPLLGRLSPVALTVIAAVAGLVRWTGLAITTELAVLVVLQPLHALTFGAQYMAAMRWLSTHAPAGEQLSAQSLYAALGNVAAMAAATLLAGALFAHLGAGAFLMGTAMCAAALVLTRGWRAG
ncbi:MFS transporter [Muricoccus radiodurans]|uniref:MFS transporter n=1 Tax=Muricoccus radiodurans TaxID=2231721 RepID=UPI003CF1BB32